MRLAQNRHGPFRVEPESNRGPCSRCITGLMFKFGCMHKHLERGAHLCLSKKRSTDGSVSPVSMPLPRICRDRQQQSLLAASNKLMCNRHARTHLQVAAAVGACRLGRRLGLAHCRGARGCQRARLGLAPGVPAGVCSKVADVLVSAQLKASPSHTSNLEGRMKCHRAIAGPSRHGSPVDLVFCKQSQLTT